MFFLLSGFPTKRPLNDVFYYNFEQVTLKNKKTVLSTLFPFFHCQTNTGDTTQATSLLHNICRLPHTCQASVNADSMFVQITTVTSALCLNEKGRGQNVEMTHPPPHTGPAPIKYIHMYSKLTVRIQRSAGRYTRRPVQPLYD